MGKKELEWLTAHPELAEKYSGEYIAILGEKIITHGKDFKQVWNRIQKKHKTAFIHKVFPWDKELVV